MANNAAPRLDAGDLAQGTLVRHRSVFLENLFHAYAQTDGTYAFPNSREGDMLKQAKFEIETFIRLVDYARKEYRNAVIERNHARSLLGRKARLAKTEPLAPAEENGRSVSDLGI